MQIQVEFLGPIQRGKWSREESIPTREGSTLGEFLVEIGFLPEHLAHILTARNGTVTRDLDTVLDDGDSLQLSVLLGGG